MVERFHFWEFRHKYTDATIVCGKRKSKIKGHKIILSSASLFFRKGLETLKVICLPDIEKEEFENLLEFLYRGEVRIEVENYQRFVEVARQLSVISLKSYFESSRPNDAGKRVSHVEEQKVKGGRATGSKVKSHNEGCQDEELKVKIQIICDT